MFETRFAVGDVVSIGSSGFQKYTCESFAPPAGVVVSVDRETETTLVKLTGEVPCSTET